MKIIILINDLLQNISCLFFIKIVISTATSTRHEIKLLNNEEKTEYIDKIETQSWILDYFPTKSACEIYGFVPLLLPITPGLTRIVGKLGSVLSSESKSSGRLASRTRPVC